MFPSEIIQNALPSAARTDPRILNDFNFAYHWCAELNAA